MKKTTSLIIILTLVFTIFSFAGNSNGSLVYKESEIFFDNQPEASTNNISTAGWSVVDGADIAVADVPSLYGTYTSPTDGKIIKVRKNNTSYVFITKEFDQHFNIAADCESKNTDNYKIVWEIDTTVQGANKSSNRRQVEYYLMGEDYSKPLAGFALRIRNSENAISVPLLVPPTASGTNANINTSTPGYITDAVDTFDADMQRMKVELILKEQVNGETVTPNVFRVWAKINNAGDYVRVGEDTPFITDINTVTQAGGISGISVKITDRMDHYVYLADTKVYSVYSEEESVDKTELNDAIDDAEGLYNSNINNVGGAIGQYLPTTMEMLLDAINSAKAVLNNETVSQAAVDSAVQDLNNVFDAFVQNERDYPEGGIRKSMMFDGLPVDDITVPATGASISIAEDNAYDTGNILSVENYRDRAVYINFGENTQFANQGDITTFQTEGPNADLIVEYDIKFTDIIEKGESVSLSLMDNNVDDTASSRVVFNGSTGDIELYHRDGDIKESVLEDGRWYRIRQVAELTSDSDTRRRISYYIDGKKVGSSVNPISTNSSKIGYIGRLQIRPEGGSQFITYIDNVTVYKQNIVSPSEFVDKGDLIKNIRNAERKINCPKIVIGNEQGEYSPENQQALASAINNAKEVYETQNALQTVVDSASSLLNTAYENFIPNPAVFKLGENGITFWQADGVTPMDSLSESDRVIIKVDLRGNVEGGVASGIVIAKLVEVDDRGFEILKKLDMENANDIAFGQLSNLELEIDLSSYVNRDSMYIKLLTWNSLTNLKPLLPPCSEFND